MRLGGTWLRSLVLLTSVALPLLSFDLRLTIVTDHERGGLNHVE
jgi:hypothetical protein